MGCLLNPSFLWALPGNFTQIDKTLDCQSETKAAVRDRRVRACLESPCLSAAWGGKSIFLFAYIRLSLLSPSTSLDYKLLPLLKGEKVVLWALLRLMGFLSYNQSCSSQCNPEWWQGKWLLMPGIHTRTCWFPWPFLILLESELGMTSLRYKPKKEGKKKNPHDIPPT